ncbi:hypothetical protein FB451DRAFT_1358880 [Mycena latifolia]|nr:hypothetical protein FB451DRAFT_1358880 [Mycena latifolia]
MAHASSSLLAVDMTDVDAQPKTPTPLPTSIQLYLIEALPSSAPQAHPYKPALSRTFGNMLALASLWIEAPGLIVVGGPAESFGVGEIPSTLNAVVVEDDANPPPPAALPAPSAAAGAFDEALPQTETPPDSTACGYCCDVTRPLRRRRGLQRPSFKRSRLLQRSFRRCASPTSSATAIATVDRVGEPGSPSPRALAATPELPPSHPCRKAVPRDYGRQWPLLSPCPHALPASPHPRFPMADWQPQPLSPLRFEVLMAQESGSLDAVPAPPVADGFAAHPPVTPISPLCLPPRPLPLRRPCSPRPPPRTRVVRRGFPDGGVFVAIDRRPSKSPHAGSSSVSYKSVRELASLSAAKPEVAERASPAPGARGEGGQATRAARSFGGRGLPRRALGGRECVPPLRRSRRRWRSRRRGHPFTKAHWRAERGEGWWLRRGERCASSVAAPPPPHASTAGVSGEQGRTRSAVAAGAGAASKGDWRVEAGREDVRPASTATKGKAMARETSAASGATSAPKETTRRRRRAVPGPPLPMAKRRARRGRRRRRVWGWLTGATRAEEARKSYACPASAPRQEDGRGAGWRYERPVRHREAHVRLCDLRYAIQCTGWPSPTACAKRAANRRSFTTILVEGSVYAEVKTDRRPDAPALDNPDLRAIPPIITQESSNAMLARKKPLQVVLKKRANLQDPVCPSFFKEVRGRRDSELFGDSEFPEFRSFPRLLPTSFLMLDAGIFRTWGARVPETSTSNIQYHPLQTFLSWASASPAMVRDRPPTPVLNKFARPRAQEERLCFAGLLVFASGSTGLPSKRSGHSLSAQDVFSTIIMLHNAFKTASSYELRGLPWLLPTQALRLLQNFPSFALSEGPE